MTTMEEVFIKINNEISQPYEVYESKQSMLSSSSVSDSQLDAKNINVTKSTITQMSHSSG